MEIKDLIKTFEPSSKGREKFKEFCAHCYHTFDKKIKSIKSKKMINKYNTMRQTMVTYVAANEKEITLRLTK